MDNMNDEQMQKLASMLAEDLTKRIYGIANPGNESNDMMWYADRDDDHAVGELARLMTLLNLYQDREEYEKCHLINKHIKKLEKIIENL
jgi:hypothetical protein|tara:strand:+ start:573 stop:839 length:267 start_codon:yes stop_codon:yes gene_type:complete